MSTLLNVSLSKFSILQELRGMVQHQSAFLAVPLVIS